MRRDQVFTSRLLDEFVHAHAEGHELGSPIVVRHYALDGTLVENRPLTPEERSFFFETEDRPLMEDRDWVNAVADEAIAQRAPGGQSDEHLPSDLREIAADDDVERA